MARVEDSMKKEHATLTPASKSLLEFRIRVDAHHIVVEENGTFSVGQVLVCFGWFGMRFVHGPHTSSPIGVTTGLPCIKTTQSIHV